MIRKVAAIMVLLLLLLPHCVAADEMNIWQLVTAEGELITEICTQPSEGDEYISADNIEYRIIRVENQKAYVDAVGALELPSLDWMDANESLPVMSVAKRIAIYCTHSDESYEPSDGYYSTRDRGSIYQVAQTLSEALNDQGIETNLADTLHHPHDAGAYRRSRQTAIQLLKEAYPDCLIDIHRDGIPDPASYAVTIGGEKASKIRLLVGRGNQNAAVNKEFALMIKAVADRVYPGLIKDIYMGKGTFNQDLLPHSILFECGTYTLEKERVFVSMPMMADVLNRALYGGVVGSAGRITSDANSQPRNTAGITYGEEDSPAVAKEKGVGSGMGFLGILLLIGIAGGAILSAGSLKGGIRKAGRNLREMTGGLMGKKPSNDEEHDHS